MQMKKRTINELTNLLPQRGPSDLIENKTALSTWKTNKRKKANSPEEPWNHQARESISIQEQKVGSACQVLTIREMQDQNMKQTRNRTKRNEN
jgi:hypothetical protein